MNPANVIEQGRERGRTMNLSYAGALLPREAYEVARADPRVTIVDVRTSAEWDWVGRVPGAVHIEWNTYPASVRNPRFAEQLRALVPATDVPVLFLCRSGGRSHSAAALAAQLGYPQAYNILEGFEGDRNAEGRRGTIGGWKVAGLPWEQS